MPTPTPPDRPKPDDAGSAPLIEQLDPTTPSSVTERDGAPPPATIKEKVRKVEGNLFAALARRFFDADAITQAAALAFYAALSLAPLMLLLLWATASTFPATVDAVLGQIRILVGSEAETVARTVVDNARESPDTGSVAGWWSLLLLVVGATAVFSQLQDGINRAFRTDATTLASFGDWLRKRVFSFSVLIGLAFLLLVSMTVTTVLQLLFSRVEWILPAVANVASAIVYALAFALMYHYLPDRRVQWRLAILGGSFTALLFVAGRSAIAFYLQHASAAASYGAMGALVLTMLWVYYATIILYAGGIVTAVLDERRQQRAGGRSG